MYNLLLIGDEEYNREHVVMSIQDIVPDTDNTKVGFVSLSKRGGNSTELSPGFPYEAVDINHSPRGMWLSIPFILLPIILKHRPYRKRILNMSPGERFDAISLELGYSPVRIHARPPFVGFSFSFYEFCLLFRLFYSSTGDS